LNTYQLDDAVIVLLENGTWTGGLGQMQSGIVDMWAGNAFVTLERSNNGFIYTTPYFIDKYGALMKRPTEMFSIDTKSVTAGIDLPVYALLFAFLLALFLISYINEQVQSANERNSNWHLLLSLFPANGQMWPNQFGLTRKVLMATIGFGILILSSLYQAKQAEVLMIPTPPFVFTLKDIERAVSSNNAALMIDYEGSPILDYIKSMSESLSKSLKFNPPVFASNENSELEAINRKDGIYIYDEDYLLYLLSTIAPNLCKNYLYIPLDEWTRSYSAFIMRQNRVELLESMNVIVAERMSYVDDFIQSNQLDEECRKHIFPVYTSDPKFDALKLVELSGAFLFLFVFLCLAIGVLFIEAMSTNRKKAITLESIDTMVELHLHYDETVSADRRDAIAELQFNIQCLIEELY
jgi:hypothetical protein